MFIVKKEKTRGVGLLNDVKNNRLKIIIINFLQRNVKTWVASVALDGKVGHGGNDFAGGRVFGFVVSLEMLRNMVVIKYRITTYNVYKTYKNIFLKNFNV